MRGCELLWKNIETADAVQARIEEAIGGPCPCRVGKECPLLPDLSKMVQRDVPLAS